jgi:hypothetical protein
MTETEYEAKLAEFKLKADELEIREAILVAKTDAQNASHRALVANYDLALQARDQAAISEYMVAVEKLREKEIETQKLLAAVRAEYDELERTRPRRPRRRWFGFK